MDKYRQRRQDFFSTCREIGGEVDKHEPAQCSVGDGDIKIFLFNDGMARLKATDDDLNIGGGQVNEIKDIVTKDVGMRKGMVVKGEESDLSIATPDLEKSERMRRQVIGE